MTNDNETMTIKCASCRRSVKVSKDENKQFNWEYNGFCSFSCEADWNDSCWNYERTYRP